MSGRRLCDVRHWSGPGIQGKPTVTERVQLVQQNEGQPGFLIFVPVYRQGVPTGNVEQRRAALEGFAVGAYAIDAVISAAFREVLPLGVSLKIVDRSAPAGRQLIYQREDGLKPNRSWKSILFPAHPKAMVGYEFGGRQWAVEMEAGAAYMERHCPTSYWLVWPAGLLVVLLAMRYLGAALSSRERLEHLVAQRTAELTQTQERLRLVLDAIPVRVHWKSRDSVYLGCNRRFAEDAELKSAEEIVGKTDFDLPWKEYAELYRERDRKVVETGQPMLDYEQPRSTSDGRTLCLRQSKLPLRDAQGHIIGVLSTYEDITKRKQDEEALRESEARYRAVVENSSDGMVVAIDNKVVYVNRAAVRMAGGKDASDVLGHSILEFVHEDYRAEAEKRRIKMLETGQPTPVIEGKLRRPDGHCIDAEWMGVPIVYGGKPAILNSFRDMTEHRRRAQALRAIVRATAGSGEEFFRALVTELAKVLNVKYAMVGVRVNGVPGRVRTVALWRDGSIVENREYELEGTVSASVLGNGLRHYPTDLQREFPGDKLLAELGVESYLGIPLHGSSGTALGLLCVMDSQQMPDSELAKSLVTIFAARAAAELERKEALEDLRASEAKYRQLHESMMDAFAAMDMEGRLTDCNESFRQMLGYEPEEILHVRYHDFTPAKWHAFEAEIRAKQVLTRGYSDVYEKEYRRKDGTIFPVELRAILLRDEAGHPCGMWAIVRDLTARKQAEQSLRQSREESRQRAEELETIMGCAPVALWVAQDPNCDNISANRMARSFDETRDQTNWSANVSTSLRWLRDGRELAPEELPMQQAARENKEVQNAEMELVLQSGRRVSLLGSAVPLRNAQGEVRGCVGAFLDITERKRAEGLLAGEKRVLEWIARRKPLREVLNEVCRFVDELSPGAMSSILLLDEDGTKLWPAAAPKLPEEWTRAITPLPIGPAVGSCGSAAWGKEQVVVADIATDPRWTGHVDFCTLALKCGLRACWSTPILSADGECLGTFAMYYPEAGKPAPADLEVIRQVTHLASVAIEHDRAAEGLRRAHDEMEQRVRERTAELVQANKRLEELDRLKSQFLATMSHELRTPLNSIIGFTGILRQGFAGPVNEEQKKQLGLVFGSAKHLLSLINDLLDLSRIEAGKVDLDQEPFNFVEVVDEVVQNLTPLAQQKQLTLAAELPGPEIPMVGDRKRSFQVLLNLANNAVKFTEHGKITITAATEGDKLRVWVADTGIGIKPEQMGMLFEAFRQLDGTAKRMYEGTGLGLHLCRRLLTLMHGEIGVESEFGKGSRFWFTLPTQVDRGMESQERGYENLKR